MVYRSVSAVYRLVFIPHTKRSYHGKETLLAAVQHLLCNTSHKKNLHFPGALILCRSLALEWHVGH
jgi:hypothetical protein